MTGFCQVHSRAVPVRSTIRSVKEKIDARRIIEDAASQRQRLQSAFADGSLLEGRAPCHDATLEFRCLDDGAGVLGDIDCLPGINCYAV
jgi:hypothetical protein